MGSDSWGDPIPASRQRELLDRLTVYASTQSSGQGGDGLGPFAGKRLTGADVYWLAAYMLVADEARRRLGDPALTANDAEFHVQMQVSEARLTSAKGDPLLRASLNFAELDLRNAILSAAQLDSAVLGGVRLTGAVLGAASLRDAYLGGAQMADSFMDFANLKGAILREANLARASLRQADVRFAYLGGAILDDAFMRNAYLQEAGLIKTSVRRVDLRAGSLQKADFTQADLTDAYLYEAHLEGTLFTDANLIGCDLRRATLNGETRLNGAHLEHAFLEQTEFGGTNLASVNWSEVEQLGDEIEAREATRRLYYYDKTDRHRRTGIRKTRRQRREDFRSAERAYRTLAKVLEDQGFHREAVRFRRLAEGMNQDATRRLFQLLSLASAFLIGFGATYYTMGQVWGPRITPLYAILISITALTGRGLLPNGAVSDQMGVVAAVEAALGIILEALVVTALVRRLVVE